MKIATFNVYHGDINGQTPLQRINNFLQDRSNGSPIFDLVGFQEVPQTLLNDPNLQNNLTVPVGYAYAYLASEYPDTRVAPNRQTTDGYLIVYNTALLTLQTAPDFYLENLRVGNAQARPPILTEFIVNANNEELNFLTWHNEQGANGATVNDNFGQAFNTTNLDGRWILAGDLNVRGNAVNNPLYRGLRGVYNNLDHIMTTEYINQGECEDNHVSDHHVAIRANIQLT